MSNLKIDLSVVSAPLAEQLTGHSIDPKVLEYLDRDKKAIERLFMRGYLPPAQADKAYNKLFKAIEKALQDGNTAEQDASQDKAV